jgi:membrane-bound lytic murein transglycosylase D
MKPNKAQNQRFSDDPEGLPPDAECLRVFLAFRSGVSVAKTQFEAQGRRRPSCMGTDAPARAFGSAGRALRALALLAGTALAGCASLPGGEIPSPPTASQKPAPIVESAKSTSPLPATPVAAVPSGAPGPKVAAPAPDVSTRVRAEPSSAPVVAAREIAPVDTRNLWDRLRAGFAMPELATPLVAEKERFYLQRPDYLQRMFSRGGRYLYYIVEEIEKRGMPTELALLPFVESAMNPVALSPAQAAGLWQFIPSTGKMYNLSQNWWVDNRRDVVHSTQAALDYLQKIYALNGDDWFLALASYNWGEGAVARAMNKNRARGRPTDYLNLDMPAETRHYVPKLIALKNIVLRAAELGVALPELPNRPYFVTIEKTRPIDLKLAAQFAGMSVEDFVALNPAHNRPVIAASKNNEIKLPADRIDAFLEAVERHGEAKKAFASWQPHTMQAGETIEALAERGGVSVAEIQKANGLRPGTRVLAGTRIIVPHRKPIDDEMRVEAFVAPRVYEQIDRPAQVHTVGRKETIVTIAQKYGVTADSLHALNNLKKGVKPGMRVIVRPAASQTLLTDEHGDRQVIATAAQAMKVHVEPQTDAADDARAKRVAPRPATAANRAHGGHKAARPTSPVRTKAVRKPVRLASERRLTRT